MVLLPLTHLGRTRNDKTPPKSAGVLSRIRKWHTVRQNFSRLGNVVLDLRDVLNEAIQFGNESGSILSAKQSSSPCRRIQDTDRANRTAARINDTQPGKSSSL